MPQILSSRTVIHEANMWTEVAAPSGVSYVRAVQCIKNVLKSSVLSGFFPRPRAICGVSDETGVCRAVGGSALKGAARVERTP